MASFAREILNHKNYRAVDGVKAKLEEILQVEKRKAPQRIPYLMSTTKEFPGKFFLGYLPRVKPRIEYISVTPDGFRYRGRVHATLNGLFRWFKEHFRDPIPGKCPLAGHSICLSVCLPVHLPLSFRLSGCLSICLSIRLSGFPYVCLSIYPSVCSCLSTCLSACLSFCLMFACLLVSLVFRTETKITQTKSEHTVWGAGKRSDQVVSGIC